MYPSSQPSEDPSRTPSVEPSSSPSDDPSSTPSESIVPSASPTELPSTSPSAFPSLSSQPSLAPSATRINGQCLQNTCVAQVSVNIVYFAELKHLSNSCHLISFTLYHQIQDLSITLKAQQKYATYEGSYGNGLGDGTYDQDFIGGVVVGGGAVSNSMITLFGNAWKAYKLSEPYSVTRNTRLEFTFTLIQEAEGHAICLDRDVNEDTFGGARVRCLMVGGTQFAKWDHVKKINLITSWNGVASQSSTQFGLVSPASNAVDGNTDREWIYSSLNSIATTNKEDAPWWEYEFKDNDDVLTFNILQIILYHGECPECEDVLTDFTVQVYDDGEVPVWSVTPRNDKSTDIISIPVGIVGSKVRITLNGSDPRILSLAEVQIVGTPNTGLAQSSVIDVSVSDLFPESDTEILYIGFIQDNDSDPLSGESAFEAIRLYDLVDTISQVVSDCSIFGAATLESI